MAFVYVCLLLSLLLHLADQATDAFAAFLFYVEGDLTAAGKNGFQT